MAVETITQIPWGHNIAIISKCKNIKEAMFYVQNTLQHNWSRNVLVHQIESGLYKREGRSITNFAITLPKPHSDLAQQTLKDPYVFDFMTMRKDYDERELETALIGHVTQFLLELGAGFSFVGRQVSVRVGTKDFFIDLLFYHTRLHCYVVVELKTGDFEPANAGQLNFYIKTVDSQFRKEGGTNSACATAFFGNPFSSIKKLVLSSATSLGLKIFRSGTLEKENSTGNLANNCKSSSAADPPS